MKTLIAATAIVFATATGAFAASSALDVAPVYPATDNAQAIDFTPTASIGGGVELETRANLGDGSPQYDNASVDHDIDFGATASIGGESLEMRGRLGDGSPRY